MNKLYRSYFIGFALSLFITLTAFALTIVQHDSGNTAYSQGLVVGMLVLLAVGQLVVQLLFFFHLGKEAKPRLNTVSFLFMLMVIGIIAGGSLWIMYNLNYNMMPENVDIHIQQEENIHKDSHDSHDMEHMDHTNMDTGN